MTKGLTPPTLPSDVSSLKKRVTDLERKLNNASGLNPYLGVPFSLAGTIFVSESPPWSSPVKLRISSLAVLLGTAGSSTTTVALKINGSTVATVNVAAGEKSRKLTISQQLAPDQDVVSVACTASGNGAKDLDVIVRFA